MIQDFIFTIVLALIAFEFVEHVVVPVVWLLIKGKKQSNYGIGGMKGKTVEIQSWDYNTGIVLYHAERWQAVSDWPMKVGEKAIVEEISGLTLKIKPYLGTPEN